MKRLLLLMLVIGMVATSCSWNNDHGSEQVAIAVDSRSVGSNGVKSLQLLIFDSGKLGQIITLTDSELVAGVVNFALMPGEYSLWAVANAESGNLEADLGASISEVKLKFLKSGDFYSGSCDFLVGKTQINVTKSGINSATVQLERVVARLNVSITDIPEEVEDIYMSVSGTITNMVIDGSKKGTKSEVGGVIEFDKMLGTATGQVLLFPFESASLNIYYEIGGVIRMGTINIDSPLTANSILSVGASFGLTEDFKLSFTAPVWGEVSHLPDDFVFVGSETVVKDNRPVAGVVDCENLIQNGDFETWSGNMPASWIFQDCQDSTVVKVTNGALSGKSALRMDGKTYLSQDIPVEARKGYMLQLNAKCLNPNYKWKCTCGWYKTSSTMVGAEFNKEIQTDSYQGATDGWVDIFDSKYFRAPVGAKYLRIEFRGYSELGVGEGVMIDNLKVFKVIEE